MDLRQLVPLVNVIQDAVFHSPGLETGKARSA